MPKRDALLGMAVIAAGLLTSCATAAGTATPVATPANTDTPPANDVTVVVPRQDTPLLDGTLSADEWSGANGYELKGGGRVLLMHDGDWLCVGLRGKPESLASICLASADEIRVLHSSLGVGSAAYQRDADLWQRTRNFAWTWWDQTDAAIARRQQEEFLQREGWVASTMGTGSAGEMEFRIQLPQEGLRLAVAYFKGDSSAEELSWWPEFLADSCLNINLIQGRAGLRLGFQPEQWAALILAPKR